MGPATAEGAAQALVVVVPQPDGRGLVTVEGSGVGVGGPYDLRAASAAADAIAAALSRGDSDALGRVGLLWRLARDAARSDGWFVRLCGEDLAGAEPLSDAEARRARITPRVAAALRSARCVDCDCGGGCPWVINGDVEPDVAPCAACGCCWCGPDQRVTGDVAAELRAASAAFEGDAVASEPDLARLCAAARAVLAAPAPADGRLLATARAVIDRRGGPAFIDLDQLVRAVDAVDEERLLGPVERAARVLDGIEQPALAMRLRDSASFVEVLAKLRANVGPEPAPPEKLALAVLEVFAAGGEPGDIGGRGVLLAHAQALEAEAAAVPLGASDGSGRIGGTSTRALFMWAARRARDAAAEAR